jgi:CRP/FNR family transcriptional regulator
MRPLRLRRTDCPSAAGIAPCEACTARALSVCASLPQDGLRRLAAAARVSAFDAGADLARQDDAADEVFNLTAGSALVSRTLADGRRQIVDFLFPGDVFGAKAGARYAYAVTALEPVTACRFRRGAYDALTAEFPDLGEALGDRVADDLHDARGQLLVLGRLTALERLASFLDDLAARTTPDADGVLDLPMTRQDIADYLGLTLETVSRAFSALRTRGLIGLPSPRRLRILDAARLHALAARS